MSWFPNQRKVLYSVDDQVSSHTLGNGLNDFTGFRYIYVHLQLQLPILGESVVAFSKNQAIKHLTTAHITFVLKCLILSSDLNDGYSFKGYPIIGFQNRLQASNSYMDSPEDYGLSCCAWDPNIFGHQTTFSIGLSKVENFIEDGQKLRYLEPQDFCGIELSAGILLGYVNCSDAYVGKEEEDGIDFDITYYRSYDPLTPRLFEDIIEEVEQIGLFKYGALPHWGKNRNIAFDGVIKKYEKASEFLKVKAIYDPFGTFSSQWTDQMLGLQGGVAIIKEAGCAFEGLCIFSQDIHCASTTEGYFVDLDGFTKMLGFVHVVKLLLLE